MLTESASLREKVSSWRQSLPAPEDFAPVDEPPNTAVASANDQSEGEESSGAGDKLDGENDSGRAAEAEADEVDEDAEGEADHTTNITTTQAPQPASTPKKVVRNRWAAKHELVLYLLNQHYDCKIHVLAKIFNRVFRNDRIVRTYRVLHQRWWLKKAQWRADFANLLQIRRDEHQEYREKIDAAIADLNNDD
jgi:hypothetical protein